MYGKLKLILLILISITAIAYGKDGPSQGKIAATVNDSEIYELEVADKMKPIQIGRAHV